MKKIFLKITRIVPSTILLLIFSSLSVQSQSTYTILSGSTINASAIPVGVNVIINGGGTLNMDVDRSFFSVSTANGGSSAIYGSGILTTGDITINSGSNTGDGNTLFLHSSTVICTSLLRGSTGNQNKNITSSGYVKISGSVGKFDQYSVFESSTYEFGGASQTLFPNGNYANLILSGTGTKTFPTGQSTLNYVLSIQGTATTSVIGTILYTGPPTIEYKGSVAQTIGSEFPAIFSGTGGIIINNPNGVTLNNSKTITSKVSLSSGPFNISDGVTLSLNGEITKANGSIISAATGTVNYNQSSNGQVVVDGAYGNLTFNNFNKVLSSTGTIGIAGTFTGGTAASHIITGSTIDFNGSSLQSIPAFNYFNLSTSNTGQKTYPSGTVGIAGAFVFGNHSLSASNLTVFDYNGSGSQTITSWSSYRNLRISGARGANNVHIGNWLNVSHNLDFLASFTSGGYIIEGSTIVLDGGNNQTVSGNALFNNLLLGNSGVKTLAGTIIGKLTLIGIATAANAPTYSPSASLEYKSSSLQTTGPEFLNTMDVPVIFDNVNGVTLNASKTVNAAVTFSNGKLITGASTLILGASGSISGAGAGKYVYGNLRRYIPETNNVSVAFPIGDATNYTPATVLFGGTPAGSGYLDASTSATSPTSGDQPAGAGLDPAKYVNRRWVITNTGVTGFTSYSPTFTFVAGDIQNSADPTKFIISKLNGSTWSATTVGAKSANSTQATGLTSFSEFALGEGSLIPAPVITTFSPSSGPVGTTVTITGANLNATASNNTVYFGAVKATVTSGTTTSLNVTLPAGATYQPISLLDNETGLTGYSSSLFITTFTNPFGTGIPANYYKPKIDFTSGSNPFSVAISDLDGDGKSDLVLANQIDNTISVLRNISTSGSITPTSFAAKVDFATGVNPFRIAIGDVDGDGKPDLVVTNGGSNTISVLRNTSTTGSITATSFGPKIDFVVGTSPFTVTIGDVDGDGKPELIAAGTNATFVSVFQNTSTPGNITASSFAPKVDFATGSAPYSVAIRDVDGDGKPELVLAKLTTSVGVMRNTSTPGSINASSFAAIVDFTTGSGSISIAIGDVDGDGKPDLALANGGGSNTISVLRNTSTTGSINVSSFALKVDFVTGSWPYSVAIGDMDGDGKADLVVANDQSNTVSILRNSSASGSITTSSFETKVDYGTGNSPRAVAIGDMDGDGIPEITIANNGTNSVSVFQMATPTTTFLTSSANPTTLGESVTFSATVSVSLGNPTGSVEFFDGTVSIGSSSLSGNTATLTLNSLAGGSHNITATYSGDLTYASSTSPVLDQVVNESIAGALHFDGVDDEINLGTSFNHQVFSIEMWIKPGATQQAYADIIDNNHTDARSWVIQQNAGNANQYSFYFGSISAGPSTYFTLTPDVWQHLAVVKGNGFVSVYINGVAVANTTNSQTINYDGSEVLHLARWGLGGRNWNGSMDEVRLWNRALCQGEIQNNMNGELVNANAQANLLSYYKLNQGFVGANNSSINKAYDEVSNTDNGPLSNFTLNGILSNWVEGNVIGVSPVYEPPLEICGNGIDDNCNGLIDEACPPTITSFTPASGTVGTSVTIIGTNFNTTASNNTVYFGAVRATVTGGSTTSLAVTLPAGATYQPISLLDNATGLTGYSSAPFVTTFTNPFGTGVPANFYKPKVDITTGDQAYSVAINDLDGDGKPDMVVGNFNAGTLSILHNISPAGTTNAPLFDTKVDFVVGTTPSTIAIGDVDGDGKADIIVGYRYSNNVSVLRNTSTSGSITASSFAAKVDFLNSDVTLSVKVGDIDGDGKPELIVANLENKSVSVFRNTSTPGIIDAFSFANKVDFPSTSNASSVAIGDLDGDGKTDLAITNYGAYNVSILRNTSTPGSINSSSFAPKIDIASGPNPYWVAIGDLDNDGKPDLALGSVGGTNLTVYHNSCIAGSIEPSSFTAVNFNVSNQMLHVAIGDIDGDGKPDVVASHTENLISVLHNVSNTGIIDATSFEPKVQFVTGGQPISLAIGDLDGDGKAEIATSNFSINTVSIFQIDNSLTCPVNKIVNSDLSQCTAVVNNIDPASSATVIHTLTGATFGSGPGSASGKTFNKGVTTVNYALVSDPRISCSFTITVADKQSMAYNVTGGGSYCIGGIGVPVGLDFSELYIYYQLLLNGSIIKDSIPGTGSAINFGNQTAAGTYTVIAFTSCSNNTMKGSATITINTLPTVFAMTGGGSYCSGGSGVAIGLSGSQLGIKYQLILNNSVIQTIAGTGKAIAFGNQTQTGTYTSIGIDTTKTTNCSTNMSKSATVTITPIPGTPTAGSNSPVCQGNQLNLTSSTVTGATYSWTGPNSFTSTAQNPSITNVSLSAAGIYYVRATVNGCTSNAGSTAVTINAKPTPTITASGATTFCQGKSVTFTSSAAGSYQWNNNNVAIADATSQSYTATTGGSYSVTVTTNGCSGTSASQSLTVNPLPIQYNVTGGTTTICSGSTGVAIGLSSSDRGINYQLLLNGNAIGSLNSGTGKAISFGNQTAAGTYTVKGINATTGCTNIMSGSAVIIITTVTIPDAYAYTVTTAVRPNTIYPAYLRAASLTLTANVTGSGPYSNITWKKSNGIIVASYPNSNTATAYSYKVTNGDTYTFSITDSKGCVITKTKTITSVNANCTATGVKYGIQVCQNGSNSCVDSSKVAAILNKGYGYYLGPCGIAPSGISNIQLVTSTINANTKNLIGISKSLINVFNVEALPNPSNSHFILKVESENIKEAINVRIVDFLGRVIEIKTNVFAGQTLQVGNYYRPGIYFVEVTQGMNKKQLKLIKL